MLDGTPQDIAAVRRQLGPLDATLDREPDITIRFVDSLSTHPLTLVDIAESGYDAHDFYLLQARQGNTRRTRMPFDRLGRNPEIICERGISAIPHLIAAVNLSALSKGVLPLHATAIVHRGQGILITGWSKGGKTETLLAANREGAKYVGDEWVYLTPDGRMFGVPEPIRLWSWQLQQFPELLEARTAQERARLRTWRTASTMADSVGRRRIPGVGIVRRVAPAVGRQAYLQVPPTELFGPGGVLPEASVDAVVLVMSHESSATVVEPLVSGEIPSRMRASLTEERHALMTHYRHFLFAFPDRHNPFLEAVDEIETTLLAERLKDRPSVKVAHPHPCDIRTLGRTVLTAVRSGDAR